MIRRRRRAAAACLPHALPVAQPTTDGRGTDRGAWHTLSRPLFRSADRALSSSRTSLTLGHGRRRARPQSRGPPRGRRAVKSSLVLTVRAPKTAESVSAVAPRRDRTVVSTAVYSLSRCTVGPGERLRARTTKATRPKATARSPLSPPDRLSMRLSHSRSLCSVVLAWLACLLPSHRRPMIHEPRSLRRPLDARQRELDPRPRVQLLEGDHERGAVEAPRARVGLHTGAAA